MIGRLPTPDSRLPLPGLIAAAALLVQAAASAQHAGHVIPSAPQALIERPATIRQGIGTARDEVTTASADARAFYNQGLACLHDYDWIEAARSFHQALRLDPALAMAQAGLSVAYVELNKPDLAARAVDEAKRLGAKASPHDQRHIAVRAAQFDAERHPGDAARLAAYRVAAREAAAAFPKDVELLLQRGLSESPDPAERGQGTGAASVPFFEQAVALSPDHAGAHHYLAHALENSGGMAEATLHGRRFAALAPNVPHARHMAGHSLRRSGRIDEAIVEFEAADRLSREFFKREQVPAELDWQFHHNLDVLGTSYQYRGEMKKAARVLNESFLLPTNLVGEAVNKRAWTLFLRLRGRTDDSLAAARTLIAYPHPLVQAIGHIEAGHALLSGNQFGAGGSESNAALAILRGGVEGAQLASAPMAGLQGEFYLRTAARDRGRQMLLDAAKRWRALPGPDNWAQALFRIEAMAGAARAVGDWPLAGQLAAEMLAHDAAYAGSHYASALVADYEGRASDARAEFARAVALWSHADPDLPELARSRR